MVRFWKSLGTVRQVLLIVAVAAAFTACGSSSTTNGRAGVEAAVRSYSDAYLGDHPDQAWTLLSARCQLEVSAAQMAALTSGAKALYGAAKMTSIDVTSVVGDRARVTYRYDNPAIDQVNQPWVREAGAWRYDAC